MKRLVGLIEPFDFNQKLYVFEGDTLVMQVSVPFADIPERVVTFCHQDGITSVTLQGDVHFTRRLKQEIYEKEFVNYGESKITVVTA